MSIPLVSPKELLFDLLSNQVSLLKNYSNDSLLGPHHIEVIRQGLTLHSRTNFTTKKIIDLIIELFSYITADRITLDKLFSDKRIFSAKNNSESSTELIEEKRFTSLSFNRSNSLPLEPKAPLKNKFRLSPINGPIGSLAKIPSMEYRITKCYKTGAFLLAKWLHAETDFLLLKKGQNLVLTSYLLSYGIHSQHWKASIDKILSRWSLGFPKREKKLRFLERQLPIYALLKKYPKELDSDQYYATQDLNVTFDQYLTNLSLHSFERLYSVDLNNSLSLNQKTELLEKIEKEKIGIELINHGYHCFKKWQEKSPIQAELLPISLRSFHFFAKCALFLNIGSEDRPALFRIIFNRNTSKEFDYFLLVNKALTSHKNLLRDSHRLLSLSKKINKNLSLNEEFQFFIFLNILIISDEDLALFLNLHPILNRDSKNRIRQQESKNNLQKASENIDVMLKLHYFATHKNYRTKEKIKAYLNVDHNNLSVSLEKIFLNPILSKSFEKFFKNILRRTTEVEQSYNNLIMKIQISSLGKESLNQILGVMFTLKLFYYFRSHDEQEKIHTITQQNSSPNYDFLLECIFKREQNKNQSYAEGLKQLKDYLFGSLDNFVSKIKSSAILLNLKECEYLDFLINYLKDTDGKNSLFFNLRSLDLPFESKNIKTEITIKNDLVQFLKKPLSEIFTIYKKKIENNFNLVLKEAHDFFGVANELKNYKLEIFKRLLTSQNTGTLFFTFLKEAQNIKKENIRLLEKERGVLENNEFTTLHKLKEIIIHHTEFENHPAALILLEEMHFLANPLKNIQIHSDSVDNLIFDLSKKAPSQGKSRRRSIQQSEGSVSQGTQLENELLQNNSKDTPYPFILAMKSGYIQMDKLPILYHPSWKFPAENNSIKSFRKAYRVIKFLHANTGKIISTSTELNFEFLKNQGLSENQLEQICYLLKAQFTSLTTAERFKEELQGVLEKIYPLDGSGNSKMRSAFLLESTKTAIIQFNNKVLHNIAKGIIDIMTLDKVETRLWEEVYKNPPIKQTTQYEFQE